MMAESKCVYEKLQVICDKYISENKLELRYTDELLDLTLAAFQEIFNNLYTEGKQVTERCYTPAIISILSEFFPFSEFSFTDDNAEGTLNFKVSLLDITKNKEIMNEYILYFKERQCRFDKMMKDIEKISQNFKLVDYKDLVSKNVNQLP